MVVFDKEGYIVEHVSGLGSSEEVDVGFYNTLEAFESRTIERLRGWWKEDSGDGYIVYYHLYMMVPKGQGITHGA